MRNVNARKACRGRKLFPLNKQRSAAAAGVQYPCVHLHVLHGIPQHGRRRCGMYACGQRLGTVGEPIVTKHGRLQKRIRAALFIYFKYKLRFIVARRVHKLFAVYHRGYRTALRRPVLYFAPQLNSVSVGRFAIAAVFKEFAHKAAALQQLLRVARIHVPRYWHQDALHAPKAHQLIYILCFYKYAVALVRIGFKLLFLHVVKQGAYQPVRCAELKFILRIERAECMMRNFRKLTPCAEECVRLLGKVSLFAFVLCGGNSVFFKESLGLLAAYRAY